MNLEDAKKYMDKLKEVEKSHQLREEVIELEDY